MSAQSRVNQYPPQPQQQVGQPRNPVSPPSQVTGGKKNGSPIFSIVGVVVVTIILFFGGLFYLQYLQNQNIEDSGKMEEENKEKEELQLKQLEENVKNDQIRKLDITSIKGGLSEYFEKNKLYPEKLEVLTPDYLTVIPLDPVSKVPYFYEPNEDFTKYDLSAKLSGDGNFTVQSN